MLKPTTTTLKKLEEVFEEIGYEVRYEKGSFQSGHCLVEERKVVVVNRFFDTDGRVNALFDILFQLDPPADRLSEKGRDTLRRALKTWKSAQNQAEAEPENETETAPESSIPNPQSL